MNQHSRLYLASLVIACVASGCGDSQFDSDDLTPPKLEASKTALVASLDAWKGGRRSSGILIGSKPTIGIVDAMRTFRPLSGYEVVGPLTVVDEAQPFALRIVLDSPRETIETRYFVVGRDPLWVYGQDDFERMLHREHAADHGVVIEPALRPGDKK